MRFRFPKWACGRLTEDADFSKKEIIFSDEARFEQRKTVTVNGDLYRVERSFVHIELKRRILPTFDFNRTAQPKRPVFENPLSADRTDVVCTPWSCDLPLFDYYLWGAVKDKCYADKPETIDGWIDGQYL